MWTKLLLALFCQIGMTWSYQPMRPLDLGRSINVFRPRKFSDSTVRMIRNEDFIDEALSEEDKVEIYKKTFQTQFRNPEPIRPNVQYGNIVERSIEVCPTLEKLFEAYFRRINVHEVPQSWNLFTIFWTPDDISKRFGFPKQYATKDYGYVLIKGSIVQHQAMISAPITEMTFKDNVQEDLDKIQENNPTMIYDFLKKYGTHFISSYATGGLLYQVFVYDRATFAEVNEALRFRVLPLYGIEELEDSHRKFFSPHYASAIGRIQSADANDTIEEWARSVCRQYDRPYEYSNLLKLHEDLSNVVEFQDYAQNNVLLELTMMPNAYFMNPENLRDWVFSAIERHYNIWYTGIDYYYHPKGDRQP